MRLAFYVSGKATRLSKILNKPCNKIINDTTLVFSDSIHNRYLLPYLRSYGINYICVDYDNIQAEKSQKSYILSEEILKNFHENSIDYVFCFGDHILREPLLSRYRHRIINFHPSILPLFPGRLALNAALESNSFLIGNTAHFIDEGIDTGPVIMQSAVHFSQAHQHGLDYILDLQVEMAVTIHRWLREDALKIQDGKVIISGANYSQISFWPK